MKLPLNVFLLLQCLFMYSVNGEAGLGKIVGGHEARPHSHPYLVSLQMRFLWVRVHVCGGTILTERWILTAGHCAIESWLIRWLPVDAVAGIHEVNHFRDTSQIMKIKDRIPHPVYEGGIGAYDIALYRTESPFTFNKYIKPVTLPTRDLKSLTYETYPLKIAGWGAVRTTLFIPDVPNRLREVKVTYIPFDKCYDAIERLKEGNEVNPLNEDANICTGPTFGGIAACSGDSGGPLIQYRPNTIENNMVEQETLYNASNSNIDDEETATLEAMDTDAVERKDFKEDVVPVIVGIVSWGVAPCGERGAPTVYTNVWTYIDFINYYINKNNYSGIHDYGEGKV